MTLDELLRDQPPPRAEPGAAEHLRRNLVSGDTRIAVVDDDPTGTQTVQDVWVTLAWEPAALAECLGGAEPLFFVSTNSRSLDPESCRRLSRVVGRSLRKASTGLSRRVILASRSDSTLRGHFPGEVLALCRGLGERPDALLLVPAFFEGGRYTVGDIHWARQGDTLVRASDTEFARDPIYGYRSRDLRSWVEEKTGGEVARDQVASLPLSLVRGGGWEAVATTLRQIIRDARGRPAGPGGMGPVVVCNAACYDDLWVIARAAAAVEQEGARLVYRTAASFLKARAGFPDRPVLRAADLAGSGSPGLIIAGSWTDRTTRQLHGLVSSGLARSIEVDAAALLDPARHASCVREAARKTDEALRSGASALVATTRAVLGRGSGDFLTAGRRIMEGLCAVVRDITRTPAWVVAKGGITSLSVARDALGVERAWVLGQAAPGVPVWRLGPEARLPGATYVVFPGNVGDDQTLRGVVSGLTGLP